MGFLVAFIVLFGFQGSASAKNIDTQVQGLDAPSKIMEQTGDSNTYTEVPKDSPLLSGQNYQLYYDWTVTNGTSISDGDTATVTLPTTAGHGPIGFDVKTGDQSATTIGSFSVDADATTGEITFNDQLANVNTYNKGTMKINATGNATDTSGGGNDYVIAKNGWVQKNDYDANNIPTQVVWQIVFNPKDENMGTVTLTDDLGGYQSFDSEQGVTAHDEDGNKLMPTVEVNGSQIKMVFENVTKKVTLSYYAKVDSSSLTGQTGGYFGNYVGLEAADGETGSAGTGSGSGSNPSTPDTIANTHKDAPWGGSAEIDVTYIGSVTLTKQDATTNSLLPGATYTLQKKNSDGLFTDYQTHLVTDSKGQINSTALEIGDYQFVETAAPKGYQINPATVPFSIGPQNKNSHVDVSQTDTQGSVTLTKIDKDSGEKLKGAVFQLADKDGNAVGTNTYTTGDDGTFTVNGLAPGTYEFVETTAPTGYEIGEPKQFTIGDTETNQAVTVTQADVFSGQTGGSSGSSSIPSVKPKPKPKPTPGPGPTPGPTPAPSSSNDSSSESNDTVSSGTTTKKSKVKKVVSSSTSSSDNSGMTGATATPSASSSSKHPVGDGNFSSAVKRLLPQTSEAKGIFAVLGGILLLGFGLSFWQWRRERRH
ncbi:SpaA isopeptide-forming pilin-related protein [Levilactobacillus yonginensis]|uniref:SpaA isopeptide-forming pilin-related protein n=1 Tax=Levilactobacillus yonginensis TaxID=1054041 RepID=UPI00345D581D